MSQLLTARQAEELYVIAPRLQSLKRQRRGVCDADITRILLHRHKSIIAYLASVNLTESATALRAELGDSVTIDDATLKKYEGLLEKKWTSVVRLQKKVGP
jgi:hypothetical protein